MNPNQALWEKGHFTRIAESMRDSGETVVQGLGVIRGLEALDLGCGDGTTPLPAARLGADVLGVANYYGSTMNAFAAAEQRGQSADLQQEIGALFERENRSQAEDATTIPATFLRVTVACVNARVGADEPGRQRNNDSPGGWRRCSRSSGRPGG